MAPRYRKKRAAGPLCARAAPAAPMVAVGGLRRLVTGVWVRSGHASVIACCARLRPLTNRTRPLSDAEPEFSSREEEGISRVYELSAYCMLCRKAMFCTLADLRQEVER